MIETPKIIAVDFDGTIVKHEEDAPLLKEFVLLPYAKETTAWLYENFYTILWTCRDGQPLQNALRFLGRNGIRLHAVNENAPFLDFQTSRKVYFDYCVDDRCAPVNWLRVKEFLQKKFLDSTEIIVNKILIEVR